jgi:F-type H+-transporting ATPase subunit delta
MSIETVARRYGTALADVVLNTGETEVVTDELLQWEALLNTNANLHDVFGNPTIPHIRKDDLLEKLIEKTRPSKTTTNFLRVLLHNGRLTDLVQINEKFASVLEERSGVVSAEITSARDLPDNERSDLKEKLEKLTGKRVKVDFATNPQIIGGVVTRIGSTVYDGSVKTQLENLREQLVNG